MARPERPSHLPRRDQAREQTELHHWRFHRLPPRPPSKPHPRHPHHAAPAAERLIRGSTDRAELTLLLDQFGDETGPAGLMGRAETSANIPVEIFVKQITSPSRTGIWVAWNKLFVARRAHECTFAFLIAQPNLDQPIGKFVRDFFEVHELPGAGWTFHFEIVAVVVMKLLKRFDQQIVDWEPDWTAPV